MWFEAVNSTRITWIGLLGWIFFSALSRSIVCHGFVAGPSASTQRHSGQACAALVDNDGDGYVHLKDIDRVLCISDLHVDHGDNMEWLANATALARKEEDDDDPERIRLTSSDLVVIAGDISHDIDRIQQSLEFLLETGAKILFVAGNHEAWLRTTELKDNPKASSLDKIDEIYTICREMGVYTGCVLVGGTQERSHALWMVPLQSWYDGSLSLEVCADLCEDFGKWPWVDFLRCQWPGFSSMEAPNQKIPKGLTEHFLQQNEIMLQKLPHWMAEVQQKRDQKNQVGVMTISHFLPNQQCLPDWKDVEKSSFDRSQWLNHGGGGVSAKFAKVAGSAKLDQQIRSLPLDLETTRHMHVFGHSHRPKDFEYKGIRYIHNPLGKPREREIYMVAPHVDFQVLWDTKEIGEVRPPNSIFRLWEEQGGGLDALIERMAKSKRKSRYGKYLKKPKTEDQTAVKSTLPPSN